jgi:predicted porin
MKKSLLALAVLGAFGSAAQAQVSIGGVVQANAKDYKVGNTSRVVQNEYRIDDDYTSRFWLTGSEDLGGGNSALFYIQNRLNTTDANTTGDGNGLGNGDTYVGLKGAWGQLTAGKHSMMYVEGNATEMGANGVPAMPTSLFATNSILDYVGSQGITPTRVNNSILYKSPSFSGFSANVGIASAGSNANEGTIGSSSAGADPSAYSNGYEFFLKGNYTNGPIYLNAAYWKTTAEGRPIVVTQANADQTQVRLSGSYTLPFGLKVGLQYDRATLANVGRTGTFTAPVGGADQRRTAWEVPINYTFGPSTILASFTRAGNISGIDASGAKMYVLGYDYALSKRTNVGAFYGKLKNDTAGVYQPFKSGTSQTGSALVAGESATTLALGIKHTF